MNKRYKITNTSKRFVNTTESKLVAASQKWKCKICSKLLSAFYEVDHIVEWSIGGKTSMDNLQALCAECHRRKTLLQRSGRCTHCLEKTNHSKFFPCKVFQMKKKKAEAAKLKRKRKRKKKAKPIKKPKKNIISLV